MEPLVSANQYPVADAADSCGAGFDEARQYPGGSACPPLVGAPMCVGVRWNIGHGGVLPGVGIAYENSVAEWFGVSNPEVTSRQPPCDPKLPTAPAPP